MFLPPSILLLFHFPSPIPHPPFLPLSLPLRLFLALSQRIGITRIHFGLLQKHTNHHRDPFIESILPSNFLSEHRRLKPSSISRRGTWVLGSE